MSTKILLPDKVTFPDSPERGVAPLGVGAPLHPLRGGDELIAQRSRISPAVQLWEATGALLPGSPDLLSWLRLPEPWGRGLRGVFSCAFCAAAHAQGLSK